MKLSVLAVSSLPALANALVARPPSDSNFTITTAADERPLYLPYPFATDDYFNTCKCKGENFWKAMHSSSEDAGKLFKPVRDTSESTFTDTSSLTTWAWEDAKVPQTSFQLDKAWGFDHVLRAIGVSEKSTKDGGSVEVVKVSHGDAEAHGGGFGVTPYDNQPEYTVNGKSYRVTGSEYMFGFESSGVLLAMDRKSPQYAGGQRNPKVEGDGLPNLQSFSDVAWLKWKAAGSAPSTMRYFATISISNTDTRGVFGKVLDQARYTEVPAWPGYDVDANTEQGAALMGMCFPEDLQETRCVRFVLYSLEVVDVCRTGIDCLQEHPTLLRSATS